MKEIECMKYYGFVPSGCMFFDELLEIIETESETCWIIILVTKAAGKGDNSYYLDIYLLESDIDLEQLKSVVMEPLQREGLVFVNCHDDLLGQCLESEFIGKREIIVH